MAGHLVGPTWTGEQVAELVYHTGPEWRVHNNMVMAVAVCFAECDGYINSYHDNEITVAECKPGQVVADLANPKVKYVIGKAKLDPKTVVVDSRDVGMWEINIPASEIGSTREKNLYDPATNAQEAYKLFLERSWQPWASYNNAIVFDDRYFITAVLGVMNYSMKILGQFQASHPERSAQHNSSSPLITIPQLRKLYPKIGI